MCVHTSISFFNLCVQKHLYPKCASVQSAQKSAHQQRQQKYRFESETLIACMRVREHLNDCKIMPSDANSEYLHIMNGERENGPKLHIFISVGINISNGRICDCCLACVRAIAKENEKSKKKKLKKSSEKKLHAEK